MCVAGLLKLNKEWRGKPTFSKKNSYCNLFFKNIEIIKNNPYTFRLKLYRNKLLVWAAFVLLCAGAFFFLNRAKQNNNSDSIIVWHTCCCCFLVPRIIRRQNEKIKSKLSNNYTKQTYLLCEKGNKKIKKSPLLIILRKNMCVFFLLFKPEFRFVI